MKSKNCSDCIMAETTYNSRDICGDCYRDDNGIHIVLNPNGGVPQKAKTETLDKCEHRKWCERRFKEDIPFEPVNEFYEYLQNELKLSSRKAFKIIYYLQESFKWKDENGEHCGIIPDKYERCMAKGCDTLFDSDSEGCLAIRCDSHCPYSTDLDCEDCPKRK
jgi:hypothetical protein